MGISSLSKPSPYAFKGVLQDSRGMFIGLFSYRVGIHDSNVAELKPIHKAFELLYLFPQAWSMEEGIMIKSDPKNALL